MGKFVGPETLRRIESINGSSHHSHSILPNLNNPESIDVSVPKMGIVLVTPSLAGRWLSLNAGNRRPRRALVNYLKAQIVGDEWQANHPQPVVFSNKGRLIDGQHRLLALSETDKSVPMRVEFGADDRLFAYLDTGVSRGLEDRVRFVDNLNHNKTVASVINGFFWMKRSRITKPSPEEAMEFFAIHREALQWIGEVRVSLRGVGTVAISIAMVEYHEIDSDMANEFYASLAHADGPVQPARILRDYLLRATTALGGGRRGGAGAKVRDMYGKTISACKAHHEGREIKTLRASTWE